MRRSEGREDDSPPPHYCAHPPHRDFVGRVRQRLYRKLHPDRQRQHSDLPEMEPTHNFTSQKLFFFFELFHFLLLFLTFDQSDPSRVRKAQPSLKVPPFGPRIEMGPPCKQILAFFTKKYFTQSVLNMKNTHHILKERGFDLSVISPVCPYYRSSNIFFSLVAALHKYCVKM